MRIAIVSDIHANLSSLEAVLADLKTVGPDLVVQGGDLVAGGARPAEVIDMVRELGWPGVYGNADEMLWRPERLLEMVAAPEFKRMLEGVLTQVIPATCRALGEERLAWLKSLPDQSFHDDVVVMHATPGNVWRSPGANASDDELERAYGSVGRRYIVYGHIHHPFVRRLSNFTVINSGCLSMSYDGDPRASYVVIDGDSIEIRRVAYDVEGEIARLIDARYPDAEWVGEIIRTGRFSPPPADVQ